MEFNTSDAPPRTLDSETVNSAYLPLYDDDDEFKDFTFYVGPKRFPIKAHVTVLRARSPALKRMITKDV